MPPMLRDGVGAGPGEDPQSRTDIETRNGPQNGGKTPGEPKTGSRVREKTNGKGALGGQTAPW